MSDASTESKFAELKAGLRRCSPATIDAAIRYRTTGDLKAISTVVFGILERYQPATAAVKISAASDNDRLIEDIGLDSLTLLEIVMSIEETLQIRIGNDELRELRTLGQLNQFLQAKISGTKTETAVRRYSREELTLALPQQPPFLFLDSAELEESVARATYLIKGNESFLDGHFKGDPVFPASIVFEALGQAACLWVLERGAAQLGKELKSNQVYFASLDGAHFHRKARPGETLRFEVKLLKLRDPLAIFQGTVTSPAGRVATIERLVLAFGEELTAEKADALAAIPALPATPQMATTELTNSLVSHTSTH